MLGLWRALSSASTVWPLLLVEPVRGLVDKKFNIVVRNLKPQQEVTIHCLHQSEDNDFWEAFGHYVSDNQGTITVAKDASLGGTYEGVESMGLMWSLRPVLGNRIGPRLRRKDVLSPLNFNISAYDGYISQDFRQFKPLSVCVVERWYVSPGVRRVDVREKGVKGTLFLPPGPGPFPGLLDLWGGGGGLVEYRAALLASHGFVSLALEYLQSEQTGTFSKSYFETAYQILQNHPMVRRDRLALIGLCFGTGVSLFLAAYSQIINPSCCVCISGSHVIPADFSQTALFEQVFHNVRKIREENNQLIWRDIILPLPSDLNKKVDVGLIKCPLLLVNGADDQNWPTTESADDIMQMMEKAGNLHLLQVLTYPGAGHLIEPPYTPHHRASSFIMPPKQKVILLWGGQAKPHADAQEDSWEKILAFLQKHLYQAAPQAKL